MENAQTIAQWQQFLQALTPVEGWLYIGAGRGEVLRETRFTAVPKLLAVEAEPHASQLLAHAMAPHNNENSHWKALHALVNNADGQATWHQLSREEESGLLPADMLKALWPNLAEHHCTEHLAVSLSRLLEQTGETQEHYNWLTIDCLPAARLLQGLNDTLEPLDMIEVRVAIDGMAQRETGATLEECDELLLPKGFTRLALEEANNPLIGRALYGRDFKLQLTEALKVYTELGSQNDNLTAQCNKLKAQNEDRQEESEGLRKELVSQRQSFLELERQNDTLTSQYADINAKNIAIQQECERLRNERENQRKVYTELESQNDTLTSQCDELKSINEVIQKEREHIHHELKVHRDSENQLKEKLQQVQIELKEQQRTAQLSTKLLAKVEADASELRERYAEKVQSERELKDLIKELHAKLQAASHFYHKLEQEHPELLDKL